MGLRARLGEIIFESTAGAPRHFDLALMVAIVVSVLAVLLNSVPSINARFGEGLRLLEWAFTGLFTLEYFLRLWVTDPNVVPRLQCTICNDHVIFVPQPDNFFHVTSC